MLLGALCSAQGQTRVGYLEDRPTVLQQGWEHVRGLSHRTVGYIYTDSHRHIRIRLMDAQSQREFRFLSVGEWLDIGFTPPVPLLPLDTVTELIFKHHVE